MFFDEIDQFVEIAPCFRHKSHACSLEIHSGHEHVPALILFADDVFPGNAEIIEKHFVVRVPAIHSQYWPNLNTRPANNGGQEIGDSLVLGSLGVGSCQQDHVAASVSPGSPEFLPVDDPIVAIEHPGSGSDRSQIGAGIRFAPSFRPSAFTAGDLGEPFSFLHLGATFQHPGSGNHRPGIESGDAVICPNLLENHLFELAKTFPAQFLRPGEREPSFFAQLPADFSVKFPGLIVFVTVIYFGSEPSFRGVLFLSGKVLFEFLPESFLFGREGEIHSYLSSSSESVSRGMRNKMRKAHIHINPVKKLPF